MGNTDYRMSLKRQFKRGHMMESNGRMKSPYTIHNNRKLNKSRKHYIQLVKIHYYTPDSMELILQDKPRESPSRKTKISKTYRLIRHNPYRQ